MESGEGERTKKSKFLDKSSRNHPIFTYLIYIYIYVISLGLAMLPHKNHRLIKYPIPGMRHLLSQG